MAKYLIQIKIQSLAVVFSLL